MIRVTIPDTLVEYLALLKEVGVPEDNYQNYVNRFFEISSRRKGIPLHGLFELTPYCNLDCKMCYVHLNINQFNPDNLLSTHTWIQLINDAYEAGMRTATLSGGECLTYPGFDDIYIALYQLQIPTGILTNGVLLNRDRINFFKEYPPDHIQVSLYGSNEDAYEHVTGMRSFEIVYKNILLAKEAKLPLRIAITPNRFLQNNLVSLIEFVEKLGIRYSVNAFLTSPRDNTGRKKEDMSIEQYLTMYRKADELRNLDDWTTVDPMELPEYGLGTEKRYGLQCGAGKSGFVIQYNGNMSPCVALYQITATPLKDGFENAWKSINNAASHYPLPIECGKCDYWSVCTHCPARHSNAPQEGHCDPEICEHTRQLVIAGFLQLPNNNS